MQRFKELKYVQRVLVFLLVFCIVFAGSSTDAMAESKKAPAVESISLKIEKKDVTKKTYKMEQGEKKKIKVSVSPKKGKNVIQLATSNKKVATVSKNGTVTAKKIGTAKIKVTVRKETSKKNGKVSEKKTTWLKIKVVKGSDQKDNMDSETESPADQNSVKGKKSLVVYFSCTGTTKKIAEYVQQSTGADIYRIEAEVPYTAEDLNYGDASTRATKEQNDSSARPAIAGKVENMSQYQNVVIVYPIWWGQAPRIISTFLESYDFKGKTIVPVCTSHSSGIGSSAVNLHSLVDESVTWMEGKRFAADTSKDDVRKWLENSGIQFLLGQNKGEQTLKRDFDFEKRTVKLNSGYEMPINGIGTYSLLGDTCVDSVSEALKRGVRLIDTAYMYHNEAEVGEAVRNSRIPREEIFVITKLYPNQFSDPEKAINEALKKLDIQYIDMMLLHHPGTDDVKAYKAMEKAVADGKIRSIGLSNWYVEELEEFLPQVSITPALVQNEIHPYYQENDVIPYIQNLGIVVQGWYPLGGRGHTAELLSDEVISSIAAAHGKSSAQVILRWNLQKGVVVIPGSSNPDHILENTELFDFELTEEEMERIGALDRGEKHDWY